MRIRTIKPEFWRSDDIDALCIEDRLLFIGLWSYVDDSGVGVDKESSIAADLFAGDLTRDFSEASLRVQGGLKRLEHAGLITRYSSGGRRFLHVVGFNSHQKINRPTPSRYPPPTSADAPSPEDTPPPHGGLSEDSLRARKEQGNRGTGEREQGNPPDADASGPPTAETAKPSRAARASRIPDDFTVTPAMVEWAQKNVPHVDGRLETEKFCDHWRSASGANARKLDWVAAWRNWLRRADERTPSRGQLALVSGQGSIRPSTTDQRVAQGLALAAKYEALEALEENQ